MKKRIIVTGSSRGIGLEVTKNLILMDEMIITGTSTSGKHILESNNFRCLPLNLGDFNSIEYFVKEIDDFKFDYLINNVGILLEDWNTSKINFQQLEETFRVNLFGTIKLTESIIPKLKSGGHIINVTSDWGSFSEQNFDEYQPHYKMSKAALNMYTKLLSKRLEKKQIKVSAFDPGWVRTDMGGSSAERKPENVAKEIINLLESNVESGNFWNKGQIREW